MRLVAEVFFLLHAALQTCNRADHVVVRPTAPSTSANTFYHASQLLCWCRRATRMPEAAFKPDEYYVKYQKRIKTACFGKQLSSWHLPELLPSQLSCNAYTSISVHSLKWDLGAVFGPFLCWLWRSPQDPPSDARCRHADYGGFQLQPPRGWFGVRVN